MDSDSDTSTMVPDPGGQLCWASEDLLLAQQAGRLQMCREKDSVYIHVCVYCMHMCIFTWGELVLHYWITPATVQHQP